MSQTMLGANPVATHVANSVIAKTKPVMREEISKSFTALNTALTGALGRLNAALAKIKPGPQKRTSATSVTSATSATSATPENLKKIKTLIQEITTYHTELNKEIDKKIETVRVELQGDISNNMKERINQKNPTKNNTIESIKNKIEEYKIIIINILNDYENNLNNIVNTYLGVNININNINPAIYKNNPIVYLIATSVINSKKSIEETRKKLKTYNKNETKIGLTKAFKNKEKLEEIDTSHSLIKLAKPDEVWNYECIYKTAPATATATGTTKGAKITVKKIYVVAIINKTQSQSRFSTFSNIKYTEGDLLYIDAAETWVKNKEAMYRGSTVIQGAKGNKSEIPIITAMPGAEGVYKSEEITVKTFAVVGTTEGKPILIPDIHIYKWIGPSK